LVDAEEGVKLCSIYDTRPVVCNISRFATKNKIPMETMFLANAMECNRMIIKEGLPDEFLIPIKKDPAKEGGQGGVE
jgi:Fe-S-cluster containining protein